MKECEVEVSGCYGSMETSYHSTVNGQPSVRPYSHCHSQRAAYSFFSVTGKVKTGSIPASGVMGLSQKTLP